MDGHEQYKTIPMTDVRRPALALEKEQTQRYHRNRWAFVVYFRAGGKTMVFMRISKMFYD